MGGRVRGTLTVVAVIQAILAVLFIIQSPLVTGPVWPFEGMTPLSWIFVGSIYLAAAAATGWCIHIDSGRALVGIALDYIAILVPFSVLTTAAAVNGGGTDTALFAVACVLGAIVGVLMLRWALRHRWRDARPTPRPVRWSFLVFIVALLIVGGLLVLRVPGVMPWNVTPELSTLFGFMFLGAAAYFAFGLLEPRWENAGGQLAGFLAYDVVLIVPFLERLPTVPEALRPNLVVYTGVVVLSGLLAIWYLLIDPSTRLWSGGNERSVVENA
jgi:hypothetical protein